jgi:hypothetical protein
MENQTPLRRLLPYIYWVGGLLVVYFLLNFLISPFSSGITLNLSMIGERVGGISSFLFGILIGLGLIEVYFSDLSGPANPPFGIHFL